MWIDFFQILSGKLQERHLCDTLEGSIIYGIYYVEVIF